MKQLFNVTARLIDAILMELCGTAERVNGIGIHQLASAKPLRFDLFLGFPDNNKKIIKK